MGNQALQLRVVELDTGDEALIVPIGVSMAEMATLTPQLYYFSYAAANGSVPSVTDFVSTATGTALFRSQAAADAWDQFLLPAIVAYDMAWEVDANMTGDTEVVEGMDGVVDDSGDAVWPSIACAFLVP